MNTSKFANIAIVAAFAFLSTPVFATQAQDLTDFETCVTSASGPQWNGTTNTCTLPYYSTPYLISSTITISSSNVRYISTGSGGTAQTWPQATLQRDISSFSGTPSPFAILYATSATNNLLIESLVINGNRAGSNANGQEVINCLTNTQWIDVDLGNAGYSGSATWPGVSVYDITFNDAPGFALDLGQESYVYWSWFYYARLGGVYTNGNDEVNDTTQEYSGASGTWISGSNVLAEYNTLFQNHDEYPYATSGGNIFVGEGASTNFTLLSNSVNANYAICNNPNGCTSYTGCYIPYTSGLYSDGIEVWSPGGTLNNNQIENAEGQGLLLANIDGSTVGAVTGWNSLSSTTSGQGVTFLDYDPNWTNQEIEYNTLGGAIMDYVSSQPGNFGGHFSFTDLRSQNNTSYGYAWVTNGTAPKSGTTLSWGSANAACLTGNSSGPVGPLPSGFSGPGSTSTCP